MIATTSPDPTGPVLGTQQLLHWRDSESIFDRFDTPSWQRTSNEQVGVVWVTADASPHEVSAQLRDSASGGLPASVDLISKASTAIPFRGGDLSVHTLPQDVGLERLGHEVFVHLDHLVRSGKTPVVIFDDIGRITEGYSLQTVFRLLHLLTLKARVDGWTVLVGVGPGTYDSDIAATLEPLFESDG